MRVTRTIITGTLIAALMAGTASADTLREALVSAYHTNPTLTAQRESLKASDANVAIARAAGRPQVSVTGGLNRDLSRSGILDTGGDATLSVGADLNVPLFTGGRVKNSVRGAKTRVEAGRGTLRAVEGDVFTEAVSAYMDVIRDRAVVELNQNNVRVLTTNLEATQDRFQIGDLTRTDVAQSEARLQQGRARLAVAQGNLTSSEAVYRRVIGHPPGTLAPPPPLPPLPKSEDEAVRIALTDNPDLFAAQRLATAAGYDVRVAEAGRLPTVSGVVSGTWVDELNGTFGNGSAAQGSQTTAGLSTTVPIFQGGLIGGRVRQAQALQGQAFEQVVGTERAVVAATRAAFANYYATERAIQAQTVAVQANELALEGVRAEQSVGTRTVLDVLDAEQELLNAQVLLVTAKRDQYVAGFQLLNAMGQAEAQDLGLDGGPLYDPLANYRRVAGSWNDWATDPIHAPAATRTVSPQEMPATPILTPDLVPMSNDPSLPTPAIITPLGPTGLPSSSTLPAPAPSTSTTGVTQPRR
ncbi:TolC family outer membrane protein [Sphingomonas hankyongi]|uniref:TolC family outer membrane protein n=1 Tax=Sphingomonas hankyongi TaxID=2908209 RepID=UPI003D33AD8F